ncbi:MAG: glycoside hydrolase family 10 protein [Elainellaceae cyanobacterium]
MLTFTHSRAHLSAFRLRWTPRRWGFRIAIALLGLLIAIASANRGPARASFETIAPQIYGPQTYEIVSAVPHVANGQPSPETGSFTQQHSEIRGAWLTNIDSGVLFSTSQTVSGVERLAQWGLNTIYPTVWNWGYSLYPSPVAEATTGIAVDPHPGLADRDLLAELTDLGHDAGMAVIPWFEFGLMTPSYSELARQHPQWLAQRQDGSQLFMQGRHPRVWLNPLHPEVRTFFVDLVTEVALTYPIDGIQFDDHFSWPVEFGYDPYTVEQYRQSHGDRYPPADAHDPDWMAWRADQLTSLMGEIVAAVARARPGAAVSLSPNPLPFAYEQYLQAWDQWQARGWIDQLIVQIYRPTVASFAEELDRLVAKGVQAYSRVGVGILAGLKNRPLAPDLIAQQVAAVHARGLDGVSFFFFESMRDDAFAPLFSSKSGRLKLGHAKSGSQRSAVEG